MFSRSSSFYELLEIAPDADRTTVMNAWMDKRREVVGMTAALGSDEVGALCSRLDEAFRTLTHPLRNKRYQRYHRFRSGTAPTGPAPGVGSGGAVDPPSILDVSVPSAAALPLVSSQPAAGSGWVQMSLPLSGEEQLAGEGATAALAAGHDERTSVTASDELQAASSPAAALDVRGPGLFTSELLDTLELLEEALGSEPVIPAVTFRVV